MPKDPAILLSYMNTQLRDFYHSLDEFALSQGEDTEAIQKILAKIGYHYDQERNQFVH